MRTARVLFGLVLSSALLAPAVEAQPASSRGASIRIEQEPKKLVIRPGQSVQVTWTIHGTDEPTWLLLTNLSPQTVRLQGGDRQQALTSGRKGGLLGGGHPNQVTRVVTGVAPGSLNLTVQPVVSRREPSPERIRELTPQFQRGLRATREGFATAARSLPVIGGDAYRVKDVVRLLEETRADLFDNLAQPEFAPFRDYVDALFGEALRNLQALSSQAARPPAPGVRLAAYRQAPPAQVDKSAAERLFEQILALFSAAEAAPVRELCIQTVPKDRATFQIFPESYPADAREASTVSVVTNLFVGRYLYTVHKDGFKPVSSRIDLIRETQKVLDCRLVRDRSRDGAAPCRFLPDSDRCPWP